MLCSRAVSFSDAVSFSGALVFSDAVLCSRVVSFSDAVLCSRVVSFNDAVLFSDAVSFRLRAKKMHWIRFFLVWYCALPKAGEINYAINFQFQKFLKFT